MQTGSSKILLRAVSSLYTVVQTFMHLAGVKQYQRVHPLKNRGYIKSFSYVTLTNRNYIICCFNADLGDKIPSYSPYAQVHPGTFSSDNHIYQYKQTKVTFFFLNEPSAF